MLDYPMPNNLLPELYKFLNNYTINKILYKIISKNDLLVKKKTSYLTNIVWHVSLKLDLLHNIIFIKDVS